MLGELAVKEVAETSVKEVPSNIDKIVPEKGMTVKNAEDYWNNNEPMKSNDSKNFIDNIPESYYDDNDEIYRVGDELLPNHDTEKNGYTFHSDEYGRPSAEGYLHLKDRDGRLPIKDSIETIGKGDELPTDDRGHLIGDQFDGPNGLENLIPQDAEINRKDYMQFENQLADLVKNGSDVYVKVEPQYEGESRRPTEIAVTYVVDGKENVRIFPNHKEDIKQ